MANRKARKRAVRRDRRKAKMSGWKREGKRTSTRVGHGQGGVKGTVRPARPRKRKPVREKEAEPLTVALAELMETKD